MFLYEIHIVRKMHKRIFIYTMIGMLMFGNTPYRAKAMENTEPGVRAQTEPVGTPTDASETETDVTDPATDSGFDAGTDIDVPDTGIDGLAAGFDTLAAGMSETMAGDDGLAVAATLNDINDSKVFLKQKSSGTCTLTANVMMLRRDAIIRGDENWEDITEESAASELWIQGTGMKWDYNYGSACVKRVSVENMEEEEKVELFINLLKKHPEGIVIHDYVSKLGYPHAILLTDYTDGTFYCAEPSSGYPEGRIPVSQSAVDVEGADQYWYVSNSGQLEDGVVYANPTGIFFMQADHTGYAAGVITDSYASKSRIEYSWYASTDGGETLTCISDWVRGCEWLNWVPDTFGEYTLVVKTRVDGNDESIEELSTEVSYHPGIKGICQMPYTGEGGGYLIGFETYDNPDQKYRYEMLILDCTLLAQNKPAWIYSTGQCGVGEGTSFWTVWQPKYGYYWTLFRLYDEDGTLIDEKCFGFENI